MPSKYACSQPQRKTHIASYSTPSPPPSAYLDRCLIFRRFLFSLLMRFFFHLALMVGRLLARSPSRACCFSSSSCGGGGLVVGSGGSGRKGGALGGYKKRNPRKVASRIWA
uniref:Uncharacterized protein n=1 Tax=Aegilops tauschii subsp. strangulata TaxID=200361 RepID=A0A453S0G1_AEGTS